MTVGTKIIRTRRNPMQTKTFCSANYLVRVGVKLIIFW
jgi:hypothetical protein